MNIFEVSGKGHMRILRDMQRRAESLYDEKREIHDLMIADEEEDEEELYWREQDLNGELDDLKYEFAEYITQNPALQKFSIARNLLYTIADYFDDDKIYKMLPVRE